jgi:hypothetical protein
LGYIGPGWSYVTFYPRGTFRHDVVFDLHSLEMLAATNHVPIEVLDSHNKFVIEATNEFWSKKDILPTDIPPDMDSEAANLFALYSIMREFAKQFRSISQNPEMGFYGKFGGVFEKPEKGRVLAIYSDCDENLMKMSEMMADVAGAVRVPGVKYHARLGNGLTEITRGLDGFNDKLYRETGAKHCRVKNPKEFAAILDQAKLDYANYPFGI